MMLDKKKSKLVKCEFCRQDIPTKKRKYGLCWKCFDAYNKLQMIVELYKGDEK